MDAAYELSRFAYATRFQDLPKEIVEVVKKEVLDNLATTLGGSGDEALRGLYDLIKGWGGRKESTVIAYGGRFPSPNAAFMNGSMANALDYDDTHERGHLHAAGVAVPPAFAISEQRGNVDGKTFITAICVAIEIGCRLGLATKANRPIFMGGWSYNHLLGHFIAAVVAGKIINLDEQRIHDALGIAYHQASGNTQAKKDRASVKKIGTGFASRGGITSALMAEKGITGSNDIFDESDRGFYNLYHAGCDRHVLLGDLGERYEMFDMSFKPYPCCRLNHRFIDATLKLVRDNNIEADDILEIIPFVCRDVYQELCLPEQDKREPKNTMAAQFSLQWTLACASVRQKVSLQEFTESALNESKLLTTAAKVKPILDPTLPDELAFSRFKIITNKGTFETLTSHARGSFENPVTLDDIENKFMECSSIAAKSIPEKNLKEVISLVRNLEEVKDVAFIIRLLG